MAIKEEDQEKEEGSVKLDRSSTSKLKAKNLDQSWSQVSQVGWNRQGKSDNRSPQADRKNTRQPSVRNYMPGSASQNNQQ